MTEKQATNKKPVKRWYHQNAEILFEHNEDDGRDYIVGIYIPAFDPELGSVQAFEGALRDFRKKGIIIDGRQIADLLKNFTP
jgi:hypothetical protein